MIARTSFVSALLVGDRNAPYCSQQAADALVKLLNKTCNICSSKNIQLCKNAIINYILPSTARTAALLKYLEALTKSFKPRPADHKIEKPVPGVDEYDGLNAADGQVTLPKSAAKRLHVIYLLHDLLVTVYQWRQTQHVPAQFISLDLLAILDTLRSHILRLTQLTACRGMISEDHVSRPLTQLISTWEKLEVFGSEQIIDLKAQAIAAKDRTWEDALEEDSREDEKKAAEEKRAFEESHKWLLPYRHGVKDDRDAPWHELPAANGLYMKSTRGYPLRAAAFPKGGFELKHGGQEADVELQKDVTSLHKEMLHCFDDHTNPEEVQDIDPLGNKVWKDPDRPTRNYWGFTYDGIEKAKENSKKFREQAIGYNDIAPMRPPPGAMDEVDAAVARARELAGGRGGGFGNRGGRGRGGWRGGNGFRGGRGRGYY